MIKMPIKYKGEEIHILIDSKNKDRISKHKWHSTGRYIKASIDGRTVYLHRFLTNAPKGTHVDHIDGDGFNNTEINLRISTYSQNIANSKRTKGTDLPKGVGRIRGSEINPFCAQITVDRRKIHLGSFPTAEDAHEAYCTKAREVFGEFFNDGW